MSVSLAILLAAGLGLVLLLGALVRYRHGIRDHVERRTHTVFGYFEVSGTAGRYPQRLTLFSINPPGPGQNVITVTMRRHGFYFGRERWINDEAYR